MEIPKELVDRIKNQERNIENARKKKLSSIHYKRRKLDQDVRKYTRDAEPIRFQSIEGIGRRHGFHVGGTQFREDPISHDDA